MGAPAYAPHEMVMRKPAHGQPCNGCGLCCMIARCDLGKQLFGDIRAPCPALTQTGAHAYSCGIVDMLAAKRYASDDARELFDAARLLVRAGEGCDCRINGEKIDVAFHKMQDRNDRHNRKKIKRARKLFGIDPRGIPV